MKKIILMVIFSLLFIGCSEIKPRLQADKNEVNLLGLSIKTTYNYNSANTVNKGIEQ